MMENEGRRSKQAPRMRLSGEKRDRFLEILGQTGNRRFAAEAIGIEPRLMDKRRKFDKPLDRRWKEALVEAHRRLSGGTGASVRAEARELTVIARGRDGRLKLIAAGPTRWSEEIEKKFLATLAVCGNITASARAVGFTESCIWQRRRNWPGLVRAMEEALEEAEVRLEFRLAAEANSVRLFDGERQGDESARGEEAEPQCGEAGERFDPDLAFRFLKWREEKRRTGRRRGRAPAPPSIEEVTERIVRKVEAIRRHRAMGEDAAP